MAAAIAFAVQLPTDPGRKSADISSKDRPTWECSVDTPKEQHRENRAGPEDPGTQPYFWTVPVGGVLRVGAFLRAGIHCLLFCLLDELRHRNASRRLYSVIRLGDQRPANDGAADSTPPARNPCRSALPYSPVPQRQSRRLYLQVRYVSNGKPSRRRRPHLPHNKPEHGISHLRKVAETLELVVIAGSIEAPKKWVVFRRMEPALSYADDPRCSRIVLWKLIGVGFEKLLCRGQIFGVRSRTKKWRLCSEFRLELLKAIEVNYRAQNHAHLLRTAFRCRLQSPLSIRAWARHPQ